MGSWLIPFGGRGATGPYGQNLLWKSGHVYVMDNHRAAAWCWAQEIDQTRPHALFHIDRHTDALESQLTRWMAALPGAMPATIEDYLRKSYALEGGGQAPLFRWDNYLPIYLALNPGRVAPVCFATHHDGDMPTAVAPVEIEPWDLLDNLEFHVREAEAPWIMNVDLDYFFCSEDEAAVRFLDDAYFDRIAASIAKLDQEGRLKVITIALTATDNLTDGWAPVEQLATRLCAVLGHPFSLPQTP